MRAGVVDDLVAKHIPADAYPEAWDVAGLKQEVAAQAQPRPAGRRLGEGRGHRRRGNRRAAAQGGDEAYARARQRNTPEAMRYVEKQVILQSLDHLWREHLVTLDHLRQVIGWRGMAQRDPLNEYKSEAFELFQQLIAQWHEAVIAQMSRIEVRFQEPEPPPPPMQFQHLDPTTGENEFPFGAGQRAGQRRTARGDVRRCAVAERDPNNPASLGTGRPQRAVPLRLGQEVQALPRAGRLNASLLQRGRRRAPRRSNISSNSFDALESDDPGREARLTLCAAASLPPAALIAAPEAPAWRGGGAARRLRR